MATAPDPSQLLLSAEFAIDFERPIGAGPATGRTGPASDGAGSGGTGLGGPAYAASGRISGRAGLMAVLVPAGQPPRAAALASELGVDIPGVMMPLAHGRLILPGGQPAYAVITVAPPGPSLTIEGRPWSEADLLDRVLKPAVLGLARLHARGVTHRGIRPDNLFAARPDGAAPAAAAGPVALGPVWTTPPASLQPAVLEPIYSAMCLPGGRGEGLAADDIYALGAVILALGTGRMPLAELDAAAIVRRKLAVGSFAALLGDDRLPHLIADLVRGMLAEDPEHRPSAALLADPVTARGRRVSVRPQRRAARELTVGEEAVLDTRELAFAIARQPGAATQLLRTGAVDVWLRRDMGDNALALQIEEVLRARRSSGDTQDGRSDPQLVSAAVAVLDPLAPLCWDGIAWWPDGVGTALATAEPAIAGRIEQALVQEATVAWGGLRADRLDLAEVCDQARNHRALLSVPGPAGGRPRLLYTLNPLLPCASPALASRWVCRLQDVLPALEALAAAPDQRRRLPIDTELSAFLAARAAQQEGSTSMVVMIERPPPNVTPALFQLRVLAALQTRLKPGALPGIAAWLNEHAAPLLDGWHNKAALAAMEERLLALAQAGQLAPMLAAIEDRTAQAADAQGADRAVAELRALDAALETIASGAPGRAEYARRLGQELAVGAGMTALAGALAIMAFG